MTKPYARPIADIPIRPRCLNKAARAFWKAVAPGLIAAGHLTGLDTHCLQAASELWSLFRAALRVSQKHPVRGYCRTWWRAAGKLRLPVAYRRRLILEANHGRGLRPFKPSPSLCRSRRPGAERKPFPTNAARKCGVAAPFYGKITVK